MNWTPESLAKAFHEAYGRVSPKFFGTTGDAPSWDSLGEKAQQHLIAVAADVLGEAIEMPVVEPLGEPVPEREVFRKSMETAQSDDREEDTGDWYKNLMADVDEAASQVRTARRPFDGRLR